VIAFNTQWKRSERCSGLIWACDTRWICHICQGKQQYRSKNEQCTVCSEVHKWRTPGRVTYCTFGVKCANLSQHKQLQCGIQYSTVGWPVSAGNHLMFTVRRTFLLTMASTNHYINIQLANFISSCFDLRNIPLSNQTNMTWSLYHNLILCSRKSLPF